MRSTDRNGNLVWTSFSFSFLKCILSEFHQQNGKSSESEKVNTINQVKNMSRTELQSQVRGIHKTEPESRLSFLTHARTAKTYGGNTGY